MDNMEHRPNKFWSPSRQRFQLALQSGIELVARWTVRSAAVREDGG